MIRAPACRTVTARLLSSWRARRSVSRTTAVPSLHCSQTLATGTACHHHSLYQGQSLPIWLLQEATISSPVAGHAGVSLILCHRRPDSRLSKPLINRCILCRRSLPLSSSLTFTPSLRSHSHVPSPYRLFVFPTVSKINQMKKISAMVLASKL